MNPAGRTIHRLGETLLRFIYARWVAIGRRRQVISRNVRLSWTFLAR